MRVCLQVWDMRKGTAIMDTRHHQDYISDITVDQAGRTLLTARLAAAGHMTRRSPLCGADSPSLLDCGAAAMEPWASST